MSGPNIVREFFTKLGIEFDPKGVEQLESRLKTFNAFVKTGLVANMQQFAMGVERVGHQLENLVSRPITDFISSSVQAFADLETLQMPFRSLIPDAQKMRDLFSDFAKIKLTGVFNDKQIYEYGLKLVQIQKPVEKVGGLLRTLANASLGKPALVNEILRAMSYGETMNFTRMSLASTFPTLMDALTQNAGPKGLMLRKKLNLGIINYSELMSAIDELGERQRYAMIFQANTINGIYAIIANNIDTIKKKVGDWIDKNIVLKRALVTIAYYLERFIDLFDKIPNRTKWILLIIAGVVAALPVILTVLGGIASVIVSIAGTVYLISTFAGIFAAIGGVLSPIILTLLEVVLVLAAGYAIVNTIRLVFENWKELLSDVYYWFDKLIGHPFMKGFKSVMSAFNGSSDFGKDPMAGMYYVPKSGSQSSITTKNINVTVEANLPEGTPDDHVQYVKDGIHKAIQSELGYHLFNTDNSNEWSMLSQQK